MPHHPAVARGAPRTKVAHDNTTVRGRVTCTERPVRTPRTHLADRSGHPARTSPTGHRSSLHVRTTDESRPVGEHERGVVTARRACDQKHEAQDDEDQEHEAQDTAAGRGARDGGSGGVGVGAEPHALRVDVDELALDLAATIGVLVRVGALELPEQ